MKTKKYGLKSIAFVLFATAGLSFAPVLQAQGGLCAGFFKRQNS